MYRNVHTSLALPIISASWSHQSFHPSPNYWIHLHCIYSGAWLSHLHDLSCFDIRTSHISTTLCTFTPLILASDQHTLTNSHKFSVMSYKYSEDANLLFTLRPLVLLVVWGLHFEFLLCSDPPYSHHWTRAKITTAAPVTTITPNASNTNGGYL